MTQRLVMSNADPIPSNAELAGLQKTLQKQPCILYGPLGCCTVFVWVSRGCFWMRIFGVLFLSSCLNVFGCFVFSWVFAVSLYNNVVQKVAMYSLTTSCDDRILYNTFGSDECINPETRPHSLRAPCCASLRVRRLFATMVGNSPWQSSSDRRGGRLLWRPRPACTCGSSHVGSRFLSGHGSS